MRRLAVAAALGLLVLPAAAQTPDSVAWRRYFPLAVGNAWEYLNEYEEGMGPNFGRPFFYTERYRVIDRYERRTDTLYALAYSITERETRHPERRDTVWVRYDEVRDGVVDVDSPVSPVPLLRQSVGLDAPLGGGGYGVWGQSASPAPFPSRFACKSLSNLASDYTTWIADIGMLARTGGYEGCSSPLCGYSEWRLVRATIGGTTFEVEQTTVAAERPHASEAMTLHPSVTRTAATLHLPIPSTVEAFDVTGRRVYRADASAGEHRIEVAAWAPGLYLVRAGSEVRRLAVR